jgi:hypothetical protein
VAIIRAEGALKQAEKTVHEYVNRSVIHPDRSPGMILDHLADDSRAELERLKETVRE